MPESVREITEPIELAIVEDRLVFTCTSGTRRQTYSLSFHKARNACMASQVLLDGHANKARIAQFRRIK